MKFREAILETLGRGGVLLLVTTAINRTEWYQSLTPVITDPFIWLISIGNALGLLWLCLPMFKFVTKLNGGKS